MSYIKSLFRTKPLDDYPHREASLRRVLTAFDLTLLGVGAIIGAGIFVLTGIAAATTAGPALILSFLLAGMACMFSAFAYAELSSALGGCGSAYGYSLAGLGEIVAWIIGWDLLLEYGVACSAVAIGWSGYATNALHAIGIDLPAALITDPSSGGIINLPAMLVVFAITALLAIGVRESTRFNSIMVFIKFAVIALFIVLVIPNFDIRNWEPFLPFGWQGVINGAALIFFAYIGFDAVSTAAEEAINPKRDLPIGIIASLIICTIVYMLMAGLLTGAAKYTDLNVSSPVAQVLLNVGYRFFGGVVALGAIAGLTTVILVMFYGLTRVFLAMSRDGLLPSGLAKVNTKTHTPLRIILIAGAVIALIAGFLPIGRVAELVNIGTLAAFTVVCLGVVVLRYTQPNLARGFRTPFSPLFPLLGVGLCIYLMLSLPAITWISFGIWMLIGIVVYFTYSRSRSVLNKSV